MKELVLILVVGIAGAVFQDVVFDEPVIKQNEKLITKLREQRGQAVRYEDLPKFGQYYTVEQCVNPIGNEIIAVDRNDKAYFIVGAPTTTVGAIIVRN